MQDQWLNYATPQPAAPRRWLWRVLFVVAAIAALLLLIWFLFSPGDAPAAVFKSEQSES